MKTTQINTAHRSNVTLNKRFRAVIRLPTTKFLNGLPIPIVCLPCLLLNTCKRGNNTPPTRSIVDLSQVKPNRLSGIYGVDLGVKFLQIQEPTLYTTYKRFDPHLPGPPPLC